MPQDPFTHLAVPLVLLHTVPHAPQFVAEVCVLVSQPFLMSPSQLPKPPLHAIPQAPPLQFGVPLLLEQAFPHAPQCKASLPRLISHPFET
jgi:hypothetical protein